MRIRLPTPPAGFSPLEGHESIRRGDRAYDIRLKTWRPVKPSEIGWVWYAPHFRGFTVFARRNQSERMRVTYLAEYYDIWRCFYDGACPSGEQRNQALADLKRRYPTQSEP